MTVACDACAAEMPEEGIRCPACGMAYPPEEGRPAALRLTPARFRALIEALDQFVQNAEDAEDLHAEGNPHLSAAREMLEELNAVRAAASETGGAL